MNCRKMKRYSIQNRLFQITVKEVGAELCSIKSLKTQKEYVWEGLPDIWEAHAPNLFPVIGCLKDDGFIYKEKEYHCPKHGFFRKNDNVTLIGSTVDSLTFGLKYDDETLKIYPFKFEIRIKFILKGIELEIEHEVVNHGNEPMLFSLGGHPAFKCPLNKDENYTDYFLEFEELETSNTWQVQKDGLIANETLPFLENSSIINLHPQLFDNDALILKHLKSSKISLKSRSSGQVLSMDFSDFPYLGIWAKPNADFVCIEPWIGIADSADSDRNFIKKEGLVTLSGKESFRASYTISITE